jgi:hypothetical protein
LRIITFVLLLFASHFTLAQKNEVGAGIGGFNYAGDLMRGYHIENAKPGILAYYKRNLDNIFSVRGSLTGGILSGTDENPMDPFAANRQASFQTTIVELGGMLEYNFLDFKGEHAGIRWSPFMMVGISGFTFFGGDQDLQGSSRAQLAVPFGGGFKFAINPSLVVNVEVGIRKLFFDYIDGYSDGDITIKNYQYGNKYDQDWYNFVGISISYIIWEIPCPYDFY